MEEAADSWDMRTEYGNDAEMVNMLVIKFCAFSQVTTRGTRRLVVNLMFFL